MRAIRDGEFDWMDTAPCRGMTDLFFPDSVNGERPRTDVTACLAVCGACEHTGPCLTYALENRLTEGVYGGLSARSRRALARRLRLVAS